METARNIAHSCRLFEAGMEVIPLVAKSAEALREILTHELNRLVGCTSPDVSPLKSGVAGKRAPTAFTGEGRIVGSFVSVLGSSSILYLYIFSLLPCHPLYI